MVFSMAVRLKHVVSLPSRKPVLCEPLLQRAGGAPDVGHKATVPFLSLFLVQTGPSPQSAEKKAIFVKTLTYS